MLKMVPESKGIEGWQAAKITKAADYISSVFHNLDYEMKFAEEKVAEQKKSSYKDGLTTMLEKYNNKTNNKKSDAGMHNLKIHIINQAKKGLSPNDIYLKYKEKYPALTLQTVKAYALGVSKGTSASAEERDDKKQDIGKYAKRQKSTESTEKLCPDCGKPSWKTLDEEKQKGVDGKVCWKGYRLMGTKKKGGKTVDNCVKVG
jgi:hypothetical protein